MVRVKGIYFFIWFGNSEVLPLFVFITILNINDICIFIYFILFSYVRIIINQKGTFMVR